MKASLFAILLMGIQISSWADQICGPAEARYVYELVDAMAQYAPKVTKTGSFAVKEEYPGDGTAFLIISFTDRGNMIFKHRVSNSIELSAVIRPHKIKSDFPGLDIALTQGRLGECQYSIVVRDGKFVVLIRGFKGYKG